MGPGPLTSADITRAHWMPLEAVHKCCNPQCGQRFNEAISKHHCFSCGNIFCLKCAKHIMPLDPGTAQFTPGGISAQVCSLCLEKGKEEELRGGEEGEKEGTETSKLHPPESAYAPHPESIPGVKIATPKLWQQPERAIHSLLESEGSGALSPRGAPATPYGVREGNDPALVSQNAGTGPELHENGDDAEKGRGVFRQRGTSAAVQVTLESFSFTEGRSEARVDSRRPSEVKLEGFSFKDGTRPDSRRPSTTEKPSQTPPDANTKAIPPLFPEAMVRPSTVKQGVVHSSRAAAMDRENIRQGKRGKTRVVDLFDKPLVGDSNGSPAVEGSEESGLQGHGARAQAEAAKSLPPISRAVSSSTADQSLKAGSTSPKSAPLQRSRTQGSGSWWGSLLGKAPKIDPQILEAKLSNMTSEIQALRGEVTTAEEQAVTVQAALDHLDALLRSSTLAEYLVIRTCWQSDSSSGMPSESAGYEGEWLQRFLVLEDETLSYYFRATDPRPQGTIPLSQVAEAGPLTSDDGKEAAVHGFYVATCDGLQLQCSSANKFKVELWLTTLSDALCHVKPST